LLINASGSRSFRLRYKPQAAADRQARGANAGIRPGDIVLSANGAETKSVADLRKAVSGSRDRIALLVQRGDSRIFVPVELG
jgi:serine protease Do